MFPREFGMVFSFIIVGSYGVKVTDLLKHVHFWRALEEDYSMWFFNLILICQVNFGSPFPVILQLPN